MEIKECWYPSRKFTGKKCSLVKVDVYQCAGFPNLALKVARYETQIKNDDTESYG